jgi:hypothetical protein
MNFEPFTVNADTMGQCPKCGAMFTHVDIELTPVFSPYNNATVTFRQEIDGRTMKTMVSVRLVGLKFNTCSCQLLQG